MDDEKTTSQVSGQPTRPQERSGKRRRLEMTSNDVRFFLAKSGTSSEKPELGQETATEGEALVKALQGNQIFYTLVAWRAVPEFDGEDTKIVKQVVTKPPQSRT